MHSSQYAAVALALLGATPAVSAQAADTSSQRPTDVTLIMGNSRRYAGSYRASGMSRICGYGPLRDMAGFVDGFTLMFPDGEDLEITDINFSADTLPVGKTTPSFYIAISLKAKQGGTPAAYVVRANEPRFKETGTATLTAQGGTATLRVKGTNDMGETMDMTAVCKPQKK
ncbi:MAG TPA: hypothetical protein VLB49_03510 [Gemmatimonadales bacterium]|nr:hypothetical protein [Gemmatimonadales bacterium]